MSISSCPWGSAAVNPVCGRRCQRRRRGRVGAVQATHGTNRPTPLGDGRTHPRAVRPGIGGQVSGLGRSVFNASEAQRQKVNGSSRHTLRYGGGWEDTCVLGNFIELGEIELKEAFRRKKIMKAWIIETIELFRCSCTMGGRTNIGQILDKCPI